MTDTTRKLLIGISPRILRQVPAELGFKGKTLQYLEQSVAQWASALGAVVVMVPTVERESVVRRAQIDIPDYVAALDGLILQGGADIHPSSYGEKSTHTRGAVDSIRDRFELELLRAFAGAGKPVFGICRGMQLINIALGGTLYQDLQLDGATDATHAVTEAYDEHTHALRFEADGWLGTRYGGATGGTVNSIHHQGVRKLGEGLTAEAWSDDGVIEVIRRVEGSFLLGVQWHPEFHDDRFPNLLPADPLMSAFLEAAAACRG
jgi:gamma-glutamyl-gamma-aminobutyrate hydrolase PuuD